MFVFSPEDVEALVEETGLIKVQVQQWARHFRARWVSKPLNEVMDFLRGVDKVT